jgi:hypothetical protein
MKRKVVMAQMHETSFVEGFGELKKTLTKKAYPAIDFIFDSELAGVMFTVGERTCFIPIINFKVVLLGEEIFN